MTDKKMWNIGKYGVPKEFTACPSCGFQYGYKKRKVCLSCQECSSCCNCEAPNLVDAKKAISLILENDM